MTDYLADWLTTDLGKAVQEYIDSGFKIFPLYGIDNDLSCMCGDVNCKSPGKHPYSPTAPNGLLNATGDISKAGEMFEYRTDLNLAIATGKESGFIVLDVDNKNAGAGDDSIAKLQEFLGFLPPTRCFSTGNGYHLLFKNPDGGLKSSTRSFGDDYPGVDVRADGGYIAAPPSRHYSGRYYIDDAPNVPIAEIGALYIDLLRAKREKKQKEVSDRQQRSGNNSEWTEEQITEALSFIDPDISYLDWIFIGMGLHREGFPLDMWDRWSAGGQKYQGIADLNTHWRGFNKSGERTIGTVIDWAMTRGWKPKQEPRIVNLDAEAAVAPFIEKVKKKAAKTTDTPSPAPNAVENITPQFCFDPMELPGVIGETVRWITKYAIYDQPALALLNVLAFAGTVFGRRYSSPIDTRTNIYIVAIARTGWGKDQSRQMINRLAMESGLSDFIGGNSIRSDTGMLRGLMNHSCQLLQLDEFGIFMQALSDPKAPHHVRAVSRAFMSLYSDSKSVYHHGDYADQKMTPIKIVNPNLCIYGTTTEESYIPALKRSALKSGELNRFIVMPSGVVPVPKRDIPIKESDINLIEWWSQFAPKVGDTLGTLMGNGVALPEMKIVGWGGCEERQHALNLEQTLKANEDTPTRDLWSRLMENVIKIALIFAIARDPENPEFCQQDFDYAESIVRTSIAYMASLITNCLMETPREQHHHDLLHAIKDAGEHGILRSKLLSAFRYLGRKDIDDLLATFIDEEIVVADRFTDKPGARAKTIYKYVGKKEEVKQAASL